MDLESVSPALRRVAGWVLKALAALATFVVVYRLTRLFDTWKPQVTAQGSDAVLAALVVSFVSRRLPYSRRRRRLALLARIEELPLGSPELTTLALRHFRLRARLVGLASALLVPVAGYGLVTAFGGSWSTGLLTVGLVLFVLLQGALGLGAEIRRLRALVAAASGDDIARWNLVRSLARDASDSADPVSLAIWRRIAPPAAPGPAAEASVSVA